MSSSNDSPNAPIYMTPSTTSSSSPPSQSATGPAQAAGSAPGAATGAGTGGTAESTKNTAPALSPPRESGNTTAAAPGAATGTATTSSSANAPDSRLNPRSCVTCRRRKVRCNKREPCSNCVKAGIECIFPGPGRAPRKPRRPPDAELLARLRRLEGVVESLGGPATIDQLIMNQQRPAASTAMSPSQEGNETEKRVGRTDVDDSDPKQVQAKHGGTEELGRLVIDDTKSRYVSNRFWASLGDQIEELQDILDHSSDEEEDYPSPGESVKSGSRSHDAFIFGYSSLANSLRNYHPTPTQAFILWKTYEQNVSPLLTVVHKPTIRNIIIDAATNLESLNKNTEALAFSVYLSAVISMTPQQCIAELGEDRENAISRFRFATEQGMARANLLNSQNITLLQAAVMFLSCIRRQDDSRFVWTLSALILRLASGLGLHRDGTHFGLSPFETEMRRRLWWNICILDVRAAEDHGTDPMINDLIYDTHLPLNINDDDISPDSKTPPPERVGCTDMTFALIRCEVTLAYRRLTYIPPGAVSLPSSLEDRENLIEKLHNRLNERYIRHCDMQIPLQWVCATVARLIVAKLWLIVHQPLAKLDRSELSNDARNKLLLTSIEVIEFSRLLETNENTARWSWLFVSYNQWHAVAFVLAELCVRPLCPGVDRAWIAVNSIFRDWERQGMSKKGLLWRPLSKLMKKATDFRKKQLEELRNKYGPSPLVSQADAPSAFTSAASTHTIPSAVNFNKPGVTGSQVGSTPSLVSTSSPPVNGTPAQDQPQPPQQQQQQQQQQQFTLPSSSAAEFGLDLDKGMPDLLQDLLPAHSMTGQNWESMPIQPTSGSLDSYNISQTTGFSGNTPSFAPPNSAIFPAPGQAEAMNMFEAPLSWDQFDNVMRDFQMDLTQGAGDGQNMMGNMHMDFL